MPVSTDISHFRKCAQNDGGCAPFRCKSMARQYQRASDCRAARKSAGIGGPLLARQTSTHAGNMKKSKHAASGHLLIASTTCGTAA